MNETIASRSLTPEEEEKQQRDREAKVFSYFNRDFQVLLRYGHDWSPCHIDYQDIKWALHMTKEEFDTTLKSLGFIIKQDDKCKVVIDIPEPENGSEESSIQSWLRMFRSELSKVIHSNPDRL